MSLELSPCSGIMLARNRLTCCLSGHLETDAGAFGISMKRLSYLSIFGCFLCLAITVRVAWCYSAANSIEPGMTHEEINRILPGGASCFCTGSHCWTIYHESGISAIFEPNENGVWVATEVMRIPKSLLGIIELP